MLPTVIRADSSRIEEVRDVLADAFVEDPIIVWMLSEARNSRVSRQRMFERGVHTLVRYGVVEVTTGGEAAAMWSPPGFKKAEGIRGFLDELLGVWSSWRALGGRLGRLACAQTSGVRWAAAWAGRAASTR